MKELGYIFAKIRGKIFKNEKEVVCQYFRDNGMQIGENCNICCNIMTTEPYLIKLGKNVTISGNVKFITHDNSISKVIEGTTDVFGRVIIGENCFIGQNATILYGVSLADNIIVAAGAVVTKSFSESRVIVGGNPAKIIGTWEDYAKKARKKAINVNSVSYEEKKQMVINNLVQK